MKENEKEKLYEAMDQLIEQAKKTGKKNIEVTLASGGYSSLNEVIKTQKQADLFMRRLKELEKLNK